MSQIREKKNQRNMKPKLWTRKLNKTESTRSRKLIQLKISMSAELLGIPTTIGWFDDNETISASGLHVNETSVHGQELGWWKYWRTSIGGAAGVLSLSDAVLCADVWAPLRG